MTIVTEFESWAEQHVPFVQKRSDALVVADYLSLVEEESVRKEILAVRDELSVVLQRVREKHPREKKDLSDVPMEGTPGTIIQAMLEQLWLKEGTLMTLEELKEAWHKAGGTPLPEAKRSGGFPKDLQRAISTLKVGGLFRVPGDKFVFLSAANSGVSFESLDKINGDKPSYIGLTLAQLLAVRPRTVTTDEIMASSGDGREKSATANKPYKGQLLANQIKILNEIGEGGSDFIIQVIRGAGYRCLTAKDFSRDTVTLMSQLKLWGREADTLLHLLERRNQTVSPEELLAASGNESNEANTALNVLISLLRKKVDPVGHTLETLQPAQRRLQATGYTLHVPDSFDREESADVGDDHDEAADDETNGTEEGDDTQEESAETEDGCQDDTPAEETDAQDTTDETEDEPEESDSEEIATSEESNVSEDVRGDSPEEGADTPEGDDVREAHPQDAAPETPSVPEIPDFTKQRGVWGLGEYVRHFIVQGSTGYEEHEEEFTLVAQEVARRAPLETNDFASALKLLAYSYGPYPEHRATALLIKTIERSIDDEIPLKPLMALLAAEPRFGAFLADYRDRHPESPVTRLFSSMMNLQDAVVSDAFDPEAMTDMEDNYAKKLKPKAARPPAPPAEPKKGVSSSKTRHPVKKDDEDEDA